MSCFKGSFDLIVDRYLSFKTTPLWNITVYAVPENKCKPFSIKKASQIDRFYKPINILQHIMV